MGIPQIGKALLVLPASAVHEVNQRYRELGLGSGFKSIEGPLGEGYLDPPLVINGCINVDISTFPKVPIPVGGIIS